MVSKKLSAELPVTQEPNEKLAPSLAIALLTVGVTTLIPTIVMRASACRSWFPWAVSANFQIFGATRMPAATPGARVEVVIIA